MTALAVVNGSPHRVTLFATGDGMWRACCVSCTWKSAKYHARDHADHAAQNHAEVTGNGEWLTS